jgi:CubicO group peptidase (beta-lactamase class C family)
VKFSVLERKLTEQLEGAIQDVTPGVMIRAYQNGRLICDVAIGTTYAYYDLASLTKVIYTVQAMMLAFEEKKWDLQTRLSDILPWVKNKETLVKDLLSHSAGYLWWSDFYNRLDLNQSWQARREQLRQELAELKVEPQASSVYSDIDFLILGFVLEKFYDKNLVDIWNDIKTQFYEGTTLEFHPRNTTITPKNLFAPTEECPWRKRQLQGEVHDQNCWAMGGVSTHAGLFGSIDDVGWYVLHLRSQLLGIARYKIKQKTALLFAERARPEGTGDWALGFMLPTPGAASCGGYFSLKSIGHTGFTGTSVWYDPKSDLAVVILSNRLVYGVENKAFNALRPKIHNWLVEGLRRSSFGG